MLYEGSEEAHCSRSQAHTDQSPILGSYETRGYTSTAPHAPSQSPSRGSRLICDLQPPTVPHRSLPPNRALKLSSFPLLQHLKEMLKIDPPLGWLFCNLPQLVKKEVIVNKCGFPGRFKWQQSQRFQQHGGERNRGRRGLDNKGPGQWSSPSGNQVKVFPALLDCKL